ncbi:hypothetical protein BDZ45DRAFT_436647 [Acephala macrosclerotiorum]|nr:hypothetical protein BDZ45DRAFT_436647 [Acephala macrosclerotiorum]
MLLSEDFFLGVPGFLEVYGYYSLQLKKWNIDPTVQHLISSLMTIGTFLSSLLVGPLSSKFGRRHGLWAAAALNAIATAIMLSTTNVSALYTARLIFGTFSSSQSKHLQIDFGTGVSVGWFFAFLLSAFMLRMDHHGSTSHHSAQSIHLPTSNVYIGVWLIRN